MSRQSTKPFRACQPTTGGGDPFPLTANAGGLGEKRKSAVVVALAIACGLAMSASAQIREDYSATPVFGGNGGGSFEGYCPRNTYLIGIGGRTGEWIDAIQPICAQWNSAAQAFNPPVTGPTSGGSGGGPATLMCPARMVVTGWQIARMYVRNASIVRYVRPQCETVSPESRAGVQIPGQFGGGGIAAPADLMGYKCPQREFANGIYGASGAYVDRAGLRCEAEPAILGRAVVPESAHVKSLGRVPVSPGPDRPERSICEMARDARARNSPAAPSLEAQCRAAGERPAASAAMDQACQWKYSPGGTGSFRNLAVGPALSELGFGDFDGDGKTDVFAVKDIGGGAFQWMYSPGGTGSFRNLAVGPALSGLRFGDFDGDGKTDVFAVKDIGGGAFQWMYSPGGIGSFRNLAVGPALSGLRFGDFDGDGKTDVFAVKDIGGGAFQWMYSPGGTGSFRNLAVGPALSELGFGDFDGDGKTDVFAAKDIGGGAFQWMYSPGGTGSFRNLAVGPALSGLRFGDFDGDRRTDVFAVKDIGGGAFQWMYSPGGTGSFRNLAVGPALSGLRFSDFDGDRKTDVFVTVCP